MARAAVLEPKNGAKAAWMEDAQEAIEALAREARSAGSTFCSDALRERIEPPDHASWFGVAWAAASRRGIITPVGWAISKTRSRSGGPVRVWQPLGK